VLWSSGYYPALIYTSLALALFLFRTLHLRVEPEVNLHCTVHSFVHLDLDPELIAGWTSVIMCWIWIQVKDGIKGKELSSSIYIFK
jgi:hypothetical protein